MNDPIINKVAESGLITINLEDFLPKHEIMVFDLKDYLFMGLILKEKDFREALKNMDWTIYQDKAVAITCSADAVIPVWAYMLVAANLQPVTTQFMVGDVSYVQQQLLLRQLTTLEAEDYRDKRVVIKGCGDKALGPFAYAEITRLLRPVVKSIMYGEPCSTVPIYKQPMVKKI